MSVNRLKLDVTDPLAASPMLGNLTAHAVPGAEHSDPDRGRHSRIIPTTAGPRAVTIEISESGVFLEHEVDDPTERDELLAKVRGWLDLNVDPAAIAAVLGPDPVVGPLVARWPGLRAIGSPDGFESTVTTVLGQQVTLAAGRTFGGRLVAAFGDPGPGGLTLFPRPERLGSTPVEEIQAAIGLTHARARTIQGVAAAFANGFSLVPGRIEPAHARVELLKLRGIGEWTADYVILRVLGDRDIFPGTDLVLRRMLGVGTAAEAENLARAWRPWRTYAAFYLWSLATLGSWEETVSSPRAHSSRR